MSMNCLPQYLERASLLRHRRDPMPAAVSEATSYEYA